MKCKIKNDRLGFLLILILIFTSCGKNPHKSPDEDNSLPTNSVEALLPEGDRSGCNILYPEGLPDVVAIIQCDNQEQLVLLDDGRLVVDSTVDPTPYLPVCTDDELIKNGSFEIGHGLGNNQWGVFAQIPGWQIDNGVDAPIEIQNGQNIGEISPSHGDAKLELDSHNKNGFTKSDAVVFQEVDTKPGKVYKLKFDYSARKKRNVSTNIVEVYWNGKKVAHVNNDDRGWETFELSVVATSETSRVDFRAREDRDTVGGYIDNVSLKELCD